jgi:hypothetical protein
VSNALRGPRALERAGNWAERGVRESAGLSAERGGERATRLGRAGEERRLLGRLQVCWLGWSRVWAGLLKTGLGLLIPFLFSILFPNKSNQFEFNSTPMQSSKIKPCTSMNAQTF